MDAENTEAWTRRPAVRRLVASIGGPLLGVNIMALAFLAMAGSVKLLEQEPAGAVSSDVVATVIVMPMAVVALLTWYMAWNWLSAWARRPTGTR